MINEMDTYKGKILTPFHSSICHLLLCCKLFLNNSIMTTVPKVFKDYTEFKCLSYENLQTEFRSDIYFYFVHSINTDYD